LLAPVSRDCLNLGRSGPRKRVTAAPLLQSAAVAAPNASAFLRANAGDGFAKGRDFQAWLGLVPRQISTGDRTILGKISKRGNRYLRVLFVQAAWVVLVKVKPTRWKGHGLQSWIEARLHRNVLAIAVAAFRSSRFINRVRP
jgi:transposase